MLLAGRPDDRYDFLDLHIEGWVAAAKRVHEKCFSRHKARRLSAELESALEAVDYHQPGPNVTTTARQLGQPRRLAGVPLHNPRFYKDSSQPKAVSTRYFDREFHPYDWYVQANTEVRHRTEPNVPH
jgi:hypothetical protein